jgi:hypothetical protein
MKPVSVAIEATGRSARDRSRRPSAATQRPRLDLRSINPLWVFLIGLGVVVALRLLFLGD